MMRNVIKIVAPIIVLLLAFAFFKYQMANRPEPKVKQGQKIIPIVRTTPAQTVEGYRYQVSGYGSVEAAGTVTMVSEVAGKVIWVSDKMKLGGMFKKNEWMFRIDDQEYVAALDSAVSTLKSAEFDLKEVEQEADISKKEWEIWNSTEIKVKKASPLINYEPQLEAARAKVKAAESAVISAKSDLAKVVYKAPFDCVVTEESIEHGKIISVGSSVGTLVKSDRYEIYLPVAARDAVRLTASVEKDLASDGFIELIEGKETWKWSAYLERYLPSADSTTGMIKAVLVVDSPFDTENGTRPLLPIGANVRAVIMDHKKQTMVRIPDESVREGNAVWVLTDDSKVSIRKVKIVERRGDFIYVSTGVSGGEKLIVSNLEGVLDGMTVNSGANQQQQQQMKGKGNGGGAK